MKENTRYYKDQETGIEITIRQHENGYEVGILIPQGVFANSKEISISNKNFTLCAAISEDSMPRKGPYTILINKGYYKGEYGLVKNAQKKLTFKMGNCFGKIILNPKFYIPAAKRATPKNRKKAREAKNIAIGVRNLYSSQKPSASKYTQYTHTNIAKPYNGGRVSPK